MREKKIKECWDEGTDNVKKERPLKATENGHEREREKGSVEEDGKVLDSFAKLC